ncbi:MAG: hypothetical protein QXL86_00095 [Candidatus Aenigmatarchaeota archaeon]
MKKYSYAKSKLNNQISNHIKRLKKWKYKNLFLFCLSIVVAYFILKNEESLTFLKSLHGLGYLSAFIAGALFTSSLTVAPATALIYTLGSTFNPLVLAFIGAFGSLMSDYLIFRFVKHRLVDEIKLLHEEVKKFLRPVTKPFVPKDLRFRLWLWQRAVNSRLRWLIPVIAGFIIASPLPDEFGVALLGAAKYETKRFAVLSYFLNFMGILLVAFVGSL